MKFRVLLSIAKWIVGLMLFFPFVASAHLISISATTPFPATMQISSSATATYTVTNISRIPLTVIDKSQFPVGLAITATTCGTLMAPGATCVITLGFVAPALPGIFSAELQEWAKPSADGVKFPIRIAVVSSTPSTQFILTVSAGANGSITPSGTVSVSQGSSQTFTAIPNSGYTVDQWFVDGVLVQTGGTTFTLSNITANHTVTVSFVTFAALGVVVGNIGANFFIGYSTDSGVSWTGQTIFNSVTYSGGQLRVAACTGRASNASCASSAFSASATRTPIFNTQTPGSINWVEASVTPSTLAQQVDAVAATGGDTNPLMVVAGFNNALAVNSDRAPSWTQVPVTYSPSQDFSGASCSGSGSTAFCAVVSGTAVILQAASDFTTYNSTPGQTNGWSPAILSIPLVNNFNAVSCEGDYPNTTCVTVGQDTNFDALAAYKASNSLTWQRATLPFSTSFLGDVSCSSSVCTLVGQSPSVVAISVDGPYKPEHYRY